MVDQREKPEGRERTRRVRVLVADEHTMFREGLAGLLASAYGDEVEVVGKTTTGEAAIALAQKTDPDVLIAEVDRSLKKAKDTLGRLREGHSPRKVMILSMFGDARFVGQIMELGADAYVHKSASVEELFAALRATALDTEGKGTTVIVPQEALGASEDPSGGKPSDRELEILLLAARGMSNRQIASTLHIAESTVKRHLVNVYYRLGTHSRLETLRQMLGRGWLTFEEIVHDE